MIINTLQKAIGTAILYDFINWMQMYLVKQSDWRACPIFHVNKINVV
jgi:hypothetical protein